MANRTFNDETLIAVAEAVLTDMRVEGPPSSWNGSAGFVGLPNGMLAEVHVVVTTNKRDWLRKPMDSDPVFLVKKKGPVSIRKKL